jgi:hypothetical protein
VAGPFSRCPELVEDHEEDQTVIGSRTAGRDDPRIGEMQPASLRDWLRRRRVALAFAALVCLSGMAYSLFWGNLFHHGWYWVQPGDLWGTFHTAQFVSWGDIGDVYSGGGELVTFPGISVLLAPVALVVDALHLSISFPYALPRPTAWLILGPYEMLIGSTVLLSADGLAERLGMAARARVLGSAAGAVVLWPVLVMWGHPEDAVALAFGMLAIRAALDAKWRWCGWWMGLAVVMQPLVVLMVPVLFASAPVRNWVRLVLRTAVPSAVLLAIPMAQSWQATTRALFKQPNYPSIDHATPWLAFAPVLSRRGPAVATHFGEEPFAGGFRFTISTAHTVGGEVVAAGPGRLIALGCALMLGYWAYRNRPSADRLVWLCCLALSLRCVFESVMNPYYLWPPLAVAVVLVASDWRKYAAAAVSGGLLTWASYRHVGPWDWYLPVTALLVLVVALARPPRLRPATDTPQAAGRPATEAPERVLVSAGASAASR